MADKKKTNSTKPTSNSGKKTVKSEKTQAKELGAFAAAVVTAGVAASKRAKKGKKPFQRFLISLVTIVLVAAVLLSGGMYYYDQAPFDFEIGESGFGKFYTYENADYEVKEPTAAVVGTTEGTLKIHYIDVGQGDCIFIQFPDNKTMLIDGAKNSSVIAQGIIDYLTALYPSDEKVTIDYCMLTHCDSDHCGSLDDVISSTKIDVLSVWQPKVYSSYENDPLKALVSNGNYATITTTVYSRFVEAVYNEQQSGILTSINYNLQGASISGDGWSINLYNPTEQMYAKLSSAQDKNNISPIMVLSFNGVDILLTGDADDAAEQNFLANVKADIFGNGFDGDVNVLKVGHHGGQESTSAEFLSVIKPEYSVISVGEGNTYNHPRQETLDRLAAVGSTVYRTDKNGTVVLCVSGNEIDFIAAVQSSILIDYVPCLLQNFARVGN